MGVQSSNVSHHLLLSSTYSDGHLNQLCDRDSHSPRHILSTTSLRVNLSFKFPWTLILNSRSHKREVNSQRWLYINFFLTRLIYSTYIILCELIHRKGLFEYVGHNQLSLALHFPQQFTPYSSVNFQHRISKFDSIPTILVQLSLLSKSIMSGTITTYIHLLV